MSFLKIIKNNDIIELERYLRTHDANEEVQGRSLLSWTVHLGNVEFTKLLIEKGASINQKDELGRAPLSIAAFFGFVDIARLLLQNKSQIDTTAMDRAYFSFNGNVQTDILDLFRGFNWINIFLDDLREIPEGFVGARNILEAIDLMEKNRVHIMSLDHDLGMDDKGNLLPTGYDLVKYVCENGLRPADKIYLHTSNPVGRENMYRTLLSSRKHGFIGDDIEIYHYPLTKITYSNDLKGPYRNS
ncbi:cyclic-phosphate processing receiver domain-containing protein [Heyndrickxia ginsengihumi]|uniref:cyclic-phosphate processing receiver domain-containing protein n=1 Tax=Heyndrickxia ginsengihumi TaxID=363870 RepID=UPI003D21B33B